MIYLDNAATSRYKPKKVLSALLYATKKQSNPGRGSHDDSIEASTICFQTREKVKKFFHLKEGCAVYTKNCTEALNLAIFGAIPQNSHVITTVAEHNSVLRPLYKLSKDKKISLTTLPLTSSGHVDPKLISTHVKKETSAIVLNHVSNVNGVKSDLFKIGKIARDRGVKLIVDGAQSAGHEDIDMDLCHIDMLCIPTHKGLLSSQGLGVLLAREGVKINPLTFGGTGIESDNLYPDISCPESLEAGTINYPAVNALYYALDFLNNNQGKLLENTKKLTTYFYDGLKDMRFTVYSPSNASSGVLSFNIGDIPSGAVADILNREYGIAVRAGLHCAPLMHAFLNTSKQGAVRVSIGANNDKRDLDYTLHALERIGKRKHEIKY